MRCTRFFVCFHRPHVGFPSIHIQVRFTLLCVSLQDTHSGLRFSCMSTRTVLWQPMQGGMRKRVLDGVCSDCKTPASPSLEAKSASTFQKVFTPVWLEAQMSGCLKLSHPKSFPCCTEAALIKLVFLQTTQPSNVPAIKWGLRASSSGPPHQQQA